MFNLCDIAEKYNLSGEQINKIKPKPSSPVGNHEICIKMPDNTEIPVVSEWTKAENENLIFNNLNSCLGLIGKSKVEPTKLIGLHLSFDFDFSDFFNKSYNAINDFISQTNHHYSFGGSQKEWECCTNGNIKEILQSIPHLPNDSNDVSWFFSTNQLSEMKSIYNNENQVKIFHYFKFKKYGSLLSC